MNNTVYSITVIDVRDKNNLTGIRSTPGIFSKFSDAEYAIKNNSSDLSDNNSYQYAVIEETELNKIRPNLETDSRQWWYRYNSSAGEFFPTEKPSILLRQKGFGIG